MRFTWLAGLYLLLAPAAAVLLRWSRRRAYLGHSLLSYLAPRLGPAPAFIHLPRIVEALALAFLFTALLDPVLPLAEHQVRNKGLDIVLVVDLSSSMQTPVSGGAPEGSPSTRLEAVKKAIADFIPRRQGDRMALVVFSNNAYVVSPLTTDYRYLVDYVQMIDDQTLGNEGMTAIGEGLFLATDLLLRKSREEGQKRGKVMVLLTDGENNFGRAVNEALGAVRDAGFKIYFIGIEVPNQADPRRLIADVLATGGKYYDANDAQQLQKAYWEINDLEKAMFVTRSRMRDVPAFAPWALAALVLLSCGAGLRLMPHFTELS